MTEEEYIAEMERQWYRFNFQVKLILTWVCVGLLIVMLVDVAIELFDFYSFINK